MAVSFPPSSPPLETDDTHLSAKWEGGEKESFSFFLLLSLTFFGCRFLLFSSPRVDLAPKGGRDGETAAVEAASHNRMAPTNEEEEEEEKEPPAANLSLTPSDGIRQEEASNWNSDDI